MENDLTAGTPKGAGGRGHRPGAPASPPVAGGGARPETVQARTEATRPRGLAETLKSAVRHGVQEAARAWFFARLGLGYRIWGTEEVNRALRNCRSAYVDDILRRFGATIGEDSDLYSPLRMHNTYAPDGLVQGPRVLGGAYANLRIGDGCHVGKDVFLDLMDRIEIGDRVTVAMGAMILTHTDTGDSPLDRDALPRTQAPVVIESGAYVGARAMLLQGVTVGECAVVAAGAVVVDDVPAGAVVGGVPARTIKSVQCGAE